MLEIEKKILELNLEKRIETSILLGEKGQIKVIYQE